MKWIRSVACIAFWGGLTGIGASAALACVEAPRWGWWAVGFAGLATAGLGTLGLVAWRETEDEWE